MNEVKNPKVKKPLLYYYIIVLLVLMLLNTFLFPVLFRRTEVQVDYSTFMNDLKEGKIQQVEVLDQKIEYLMKNEKDTSIYITGNMGDQNLVDRLEEAGVIYGKEIEEPMSPLLYMLISVGGPILIFMLVGRMISKNLEKRIGGSNAMTFGKSPEPVRPCWQGR